MRQDGIRNSQLAIRCGPIAVLLIFPLLLLWRVLFAGEEIDTHLVVASGPDLSGVGPSRPASLTTVRTGHGVAESPVLDSRNIRNRQSSVTPVSCGGMSSCR